MKKKSKKTPDGYLWTNTLGLEAEAKRMATALDMAQDVVTLLRSERDRYREALEHIANPFVPFVLDAEAQTWIAQHALGLDGEDK